MPTHASELCVRQDIGQGGSCSAACKYALHPCKSRGIPFFVFFEAQIDSCFSGAVWLRCKVPCLQFAAAPVSFLPDFSMNTSFLFRPATARDFPAILALQNAVVPLLPEEQFYPDGPDFWQHCLQRGGCLLLALAAPQHKEASSAAEGAAEDELGNGPGQTRLAPADLPKIACLPRVAVCAAETDGAGTSLCPADPVPGWAGLAPLAGYFLLHCPLPEDEDNLGLDLNLPKEELGFVAHLELVLVHPLFHGQHLATTMGSMLLEKARALGKKHVCATVWPRNVASRSMLQSLGLSVHCEKLKYGGLERAIMAREL